MRCWTTLCTFLAISCALLSGRSRARLYKRGGYLFASHGPPHGISFDPSSIPHEAPSGPPIYHEPQSSEFNTVYYTYKHANAPPGHHSESNAHPASHTHESVGSKSGYSIGSGLRSIAQGSANQAYTAVSNQHAAAKQAAYIAQNTLAQAASQAAATAQAALTGKHVLLQELEQQAAEAQRSLSRELDQLKAAKIASKLAEQTAQAAHNHVSVLTAALNNAKSVAEQADKASTEVANQMASQSSMVGQAKNRLEQVDEQFKQARVDFEATKEAAIKASASAAEAQVNASKAAAHASLGLHDSVNKNASAAEVIPYDEHIDTPENDHDTTGYEQDERH